MPTRRTSTMATRTTGTSTTTIWASLSAAHDHPRHADFSFDETIQAYLDCRKRKRNTFSALAFEQHQECNLVQLYERLRSGTYTPGASICFVITRPKPREVWVAAFADRIVHHLFYNRVRDRFHNAFIADSCACIPGHCPDPCTGPATPTPVTWSCPVRHYAPCKYSSAIAASKPPNATPTWHRSTWPPWPAKSRFNAAHKK